MTTEPDATAWTIRNWDSFAEHAAPEAIEHQLRRVKAMRRAAQRDIERLAELAGRRAAEIDAGTWPPARAEQRARVDAPGMSALTDEEYARLAAEQTEETP